MKNLINVSVLAAINAGNEILEVYKQDFSVETKSDNSPLTIADKKSHEVIKAALANTGYPLLSEEGKQLSYDERKGWETFWLVDPLDGTKEFIKKNGEFTVNIALVKNGSPILGVVYVPVTGILYYGAEGVGAFMVTVKEAVTESNLEAVLSTGEALPGDAKPAVYTVVASRSHNTPETEAFIEEKRKEFGEVDMVSSGSSIKLCLVAEGKANVYPRLAPTMEWDTAAGHGVAKYAGCSVYNYETKNEVVYNKENLLNPWFVVERKN
ncbi:3'(2'),5'-bisphosphate nucleotidase CysQ [Panacibacter sp. DH6]|uniref:3'(2'),5'-bisphosphate nucleotidase CysQ n=1 Tax=Panacibacter microcysteis TaxID=2793269 RepID=A0A931E5Y7_9BACT|nr:3'(2'),5'-bisphosphate nucleotidase CysQ [Panacibacter microcysteis]MBG9374979.1 3'(2'),5'-bisphosphate nucleotidase CysQ [Panacibacter microcysteis]